ncbi:hypothetical protein B1690_12360 [Geobacillus sp. 46C-IIa]|uniref:hypothetical protein n=1 Tax=Geobacillus sp. 46C-IIa TaxID=1963025 RepID=UPI0009C14BAC|nr:hypothetical protein [Geobacillus sp. 46C-IIa]OQP05644.1 hypothetical protein B1690_12360 [Geobacillus sp. 46C-IIa]QNU27556.1 hypothetical protein IC803_15100 [Geobacillus sp. 46C-IIa]
MKNVWLAFFASLVLVMPSWVAAGHHEAVNVHLPVGHMWKHGALDEQKWMEMVQTYTPEQAGEWKKVLDERNALREQFKDKKVKQAMKEKHKQLKKEREAALDRLIDQLADKKITKEQFKQELKQLHKKKRWMTKEEKKQLHMLHEQTRQAMENNDQEAMKKLLPQWLEYMKKENERLAKCLQEVKQG